MRRSGKADLKAEPERGTHSDRRLKVSEQQGKNPKHSGETPNSETLAVQISTPPPKQKPEVLTKAFTDLLEMFLPLPPERREEMV